MDPEEVEDAFENDVVAASFSDMLLDAERNEKYGRAIARAVDRLQRASAKGVQVLDIGTGTGLLAMMAARAGASLVTACEMSGETAAIARQVVAANGYGETIRVVHKRSDELVVGDDVGEGAEMPRRADLVVMEIFDTDLIGEGVLPSMRHALAHLAREGAAVVPRGASVFAQLVRSPHMATWQRLSLASAACGCEMEVDGMCTGPGFMHSAQVDAYWARGLVEPLTAPVRLFEFDFERADSLVGRRSVRTSAMAERDGEAHAVVVWWDLVLDDEETVSTRPAWIAPSTRPQWRDHWMQAVCVLPSSVACSAGAQVAVSAAHDDYNIWVAAGGGKVSASPPYCFCGAHGLWSRHRIATLCDRSRAQAYETAVRRVLSDLRAEGVPSAGSAKPLVVCVGSGPWLAMLVARCAENGVDVVLFERERLARDIAAKLVARNNLNGVVRIVGDESDWPRDASGSVRTAAVALSEPSFDATLLPWEDILRAWTTVDELASRGLLAREGGRLALRLPGRAQLKCAAVRFVELHKSVADVREAVGFDLSAFNALRTRAKEHVTAYPLAEYAHELLSDVVAACAIDERVLPSLDSRQNAECDDERGDGLLVPLGECVLSIRTRGVCHGIVAWVDYDLADGIAAHNPPSASVGDAGPAYARHAVVFLKDGDFGACVAAGDELAVGVRANAREAVLCMDVALRRG